MNAKWMCAIYYLVFIVVCVSASIPFISEKDYKWIVHSVSNCSQSCNLGGYENITYRCISYDDPTGITRGLPDSECIKRQVALPPEKMPCNQHPCIPAHRKRRTTVDRNPRFMWEWAGRYHECAGGCKGGQSCQELLCYDKLSDEYANKTFCAKLTKPKVVCQDCPLNNCPPKWVYSAWSPCSRTCGKGERRRIASCAKIFLDSAIRYERTIERCQEFRGAPVLLQSCAVIDCEPNYMARKWTRCNGEEWNCGEGSQTREILCTRINKLGDLETLPLSVCRKKHKGKNMPKQFQPCIVYKYARTKECKAKAKSRKSAVYIHSDNTTVVQMRSTKRISLQVGQTAYVFPGTIVYIKCPVTGIDPEKLKWMRNKQEVISGRGGIKINTRGRLKIKNVSYRHIGEWKCLAGYHTSSLRLRLRYPSQVYRKYLKRKPLENPQRMISDSGSADSKYAFEDVQWVKGDWSRCSITCGQLGKKFRKVHCEKVKSKYYKVYADKVCEAHGLIKPKTVKDCGSNARCPEWLIVKDNGTCTDVCVDMGRAILKGKLFCVANRQIFPKSDCDAKKKPKGLDLCDNPACQPKWQVSSWSECSRSCGKKGVMARHLMCVWQQSGLPAGIRCNQKKLEIPLVFKSCKPPPCHLGCYDLTARCKSEKEKYAKNHCRFVQYRRLCCATCMKLFREKKLFFL